MTDCTDQKYKGHCSNKGETLKWSDGSYTSVPILRESEKAEWLGIDKYALIQNRGGRFWQIIHPDQENFSNPGLLNPLELPPSQHLMFWSGNNPDHNNNNKNPYIPNSLILTHYII